jgi:hypothetical protein
MLALILVACGTPEIDDDGDERDYDVFVNGFHVLAGDPAGQMEADHYCDNRPDGVVACVVYDDDGRLMGLEHIVQRDVFNALPADEKPLWHPHNYEVLSGLLIAPELAGDAETALMTELVSTYGKTWHVTEEGDYEGPAMLMKAFTEDGQIVPALVEVRDARFGVDTAAIRARRADIEDPGADPVTLQEPVFGICEPTEPAP